MLEILKDYLEPLIAEVAPPGVGKFPWQQMDKQTYIHMQSSNKYMYMHTQSLKHTHGQ